MCAGKAKSVYLTDCPNGKLQSIFYKLFFDAKSLNTFIATEKFKVKYPSTEFTIHKETY